MRPVERGQLWVMWIRSLLAGSALLIGGAIADFQLQQRLALPAGAAVGPLLLLLAYPMLIAPMRHYRALGYGLDAEELWIARGVWIRSVTMVPLDRVQHIDVSQGPLERAFGVSRLVLHTAGTLNSLVVLPGLARETAERIRDEIRARIRASPS